MVRWFKKNGKIILLFVFLFAGCSSDLQIKKIAKERYRHRPKALIEGVVDLVYVENHAIAFGFLKGLDKKIRMPLIFLLTGSVSLIGLLLMWRLRDFRVTFLLAFVFILSGAFGNIADRMMHGFVTDFFHVYYKNSFNFPVFNLADVMINIGIFILLFQMRYFDNALKSISLIGKKSDGEFSRKL